MGTVNLITRFTLLGQRLIWWRRSGGTVITTTRGLATLGDRHAHKALVGNWLFYLAKPNNRVAMKANLTNREGQRVHIGDRRAARLGVGHV